jgi:integrase
MKKHNENNERIKRKYLTFLKQAKGQNEASIDSVAGAISRFETYNNCKDFKAFHFEQAIHFKRYLAKQTHHKTGKPLSLATLNSTCRHLKAFVQWLSQETGYKSRISYADAEYFNLSEKETRTAKAKRKQPVATLEQIKHVLALMPDVLPTEKRNKAIIALILLTGARDSAVASFKIKHIDFENDSIYQDARDVKTKYSKTFTTYFFPVGDDARSIVFSWVEYLRNDCLFGNDDPLFPKTLMGLDNDNNFAPNGLSKDHWSNASPIRKIFKDAFSLAALPTFNPHSFRNTLASLGEKKCQSPEEFKAWSQNLGHEQVLTTFFSYGEVQESRQADILKQLKEPNKPPTNHDVKMLAKELAKEMSLHGN